MRTRFCLENFVRPRQTQINIWIVLEKTLIRLNNNSSKYLNGTWKHIDAIK